MTARVAIVALEHAEVTGLPTHPQWGQCHYWGCTPTKPSASRTHPWSMLNAPPKPLLEPTPWRLWWTLGALEALVVSGRPEAPMGLDCGAIRVIHNSNSGIGVFGRMDSPLSRRLPGASSSHQVHPAPMPPLESIPATPARGTPPLGSKPASPPRPAMPLLIPTPPCIQCQHYLHCPQNTRHI